MHTCMRNSFIQWNKSGISIAFIKGGGDTVTAAQKKGVVKFDFETNCLVVKSLPAQDYCAQGHICARMANFYYIIIWSRKSLEYLSLKRKLIFQ